MGHSLVRDLFPQVLSLAMAWWKAGFPFDKISLPVDFVGLANIPKACLCLAVPMAVPAANMRHGHSTALAVPVCEAGGDQAAEKPK